MCADGSLEGERARWDGGEEERRKEKKAFKFTSENVLSMERTRPQETTAAEQKTF